MFLRTPYDDVERDNVDQRDMRARSVPGTPSWLRARNDRAALELLLQHGPLTRSKLGEFSGLSKPTAAQMVARLEAAGLIHPVGEISGKRGPSAVSYAVRHARALAVAIDIEGARMRASVVDATGRAHGAVELTLSRAAKDRSPQNDVRSAIDAACEAAGYDSENVRAACIGVQAAVDPRADVLRFSETLPGWRRRGVRHEIEAALGIHITIENDVNLAAVAERAHGAGAEATSLALLWMGDGLGLALDAAGTLHRGASGGAGEIGYLPIPASALALEPAARDLQDLVGGIAVAKLARSHGLRGRTYAAVIESLEDHAGRDAVIAALAPRIAAGVVPVLALLDPERVILGGPTGVAGGVPLARAVRAEIKRTSTWNPEVVPSTVNHAPVLRGGETLLAEQLRELLFNEVDTLSP